MAEARRRPLPPGVALLPAAWHQALGLGRAQLPPLLLLLLLLPAAPVPLAWRVGLQLHPQLPGWALLLVPLLPLPAMALLLVWRTLPLLPSLLPPLLLLLLARMLMPSWAVGHPG